MTPTRQTIPAKNTSSKINDLNLLINNVTKSSKPPPTRVRLPAGRTSSLNDSYLKNIREDSGNKPTEEKNRR